MTSMPQSVYKAYTRIGRMSSGPSESWEAEYPGNHDNVLVSGPWLVDENMAPAVVTGRDIQYMMWICHVADTANRQYQKTRWYRQMSLTGVSQHLW